MRNVEWNLPPTLTIQSYSRVAVALIVMVPEMAPKSLADPCAGGYAEVKKQASSAEMNDEKFDAILSVGNIEAPVTNVWSDPRAWPPSWVAIDWMSYVSGSRVVEYGAKLPVLRFLLLGLKMMSVSVSLPLFSPPTMKNVRVTARGSTDYCPDVVRVEKDENVVAVVRVVYKRCCR